MKALVLAVIAVAITVIPAGPAAAACGWHDSTRLFNGLVQVHATYTCTGGQPSSSAVGNPSPRDSDWDGVCVRLAISTGQDPREFCDLPPDAVIPAAVITPGLVASAFRELPLPGAELVVQPPGGRTLVNFDTNFYTERGGMTRVVRLLGQRVELRIAPSAYGWRFGDGETRQTSEPGDAFPHLEITHRYLAAGTVAPSVDVTYRADFRVGDGPWREVDGTVTIPGRSRDLRVVTARPVLVGY